LKIFPQKSRLVNKGEHRRIMRTGSSLAVGIALLGIAVGLVWFGRLYSHSRFMNAGVVFVTYPAVVLVFISFRFALLITAFY
jgi:hypothetical protein